MVCFIVTQSLSVNKFSYFCCIHFVVLNIQITNNTVLIDRNTTDLLENLLLSSINKH